jgi:hypothetical protein
MTTLLPAITGGYLNSPLSILHSQKLPQALAKLYKFYDTPYRKPVGTVGVAHVLIAAVEVQVVGVRSIVQARTPVVAVVAPVLQRAGTVVTVPGSRHNKQTLMT